MVSILPLVTTHNFTTPQVKSKAGNFPKALAVTYCMLTHPATSQGEPSLMSQIRATPGIARDK